MKEKHLKQQKEINHRQKSSPTISERIAKLEQDLIDSESEKEKLHTQIQGLRLHAIQNKKSENTAQQQQIVKENDLLKKNV